MSARRLVLAIGALAVLCAGCASRQSSDATTSPAASATPGTSARPPATGTEPTTGSDGARSTTTTTDERGTAGPTDADPSAGCGHNAATPGTTQHTITVGGVDRSYLLTIPDAYDAARPAPLIVDFHGLGANGPTEAAYSKLGAKGASRGLVTSTPTANGKMWIIPPLPGTDDVGFANAMVDAIERDLCIDRRREHIAGISNGAAFVGGLSCAAPERFATFAMVAGPNGYRPCTTKAPMALISFHGTDDPLVPYAGGPILQGREGAVGEQDAGRPRAGGGRPGISIKPAEEQLAGWAERDGCTVGPSNTPVSAHVTLIAYSSCAAGTDVQLYRIDGGGHTWPGATPIPGDALGPTTDEIDASALMLDFFAAHHR